MNLNPKPCKRKSKVLCGVVKNTGNCPYGSTEQCRSLNVENWMGFVSQRFGTLTLKRFRYSVKWIKLSVLDENMCNECRVIWVEPQTEGCPICNMEE